MIVIDLRPYADKPSRMRLDKLINKNISQIMGTEKIIYQIPDKIIVYEAQLYDLLKSYPVLPFLNDRNGIYYHYHNLPIEVQVDYPAARFMKGKQPKIVIKYGNIDEPDTDS